MVLLLMVTFAERLRQSADVVCMNEERTMTASALRVYCMLCLLRHAGNTLTNL